MVKNKMRKPLIALMWMLLFSAFALLSEINVSAMEGIQADIIAIEGSPVEVTITGGNISDQEAAVICYDPEWDQDADLKNSTEHIVYLNQYSFRSGTLSFQFPLNGEAVQGSYTLVVSTAQGKVVTPFVVQASGTERDPVLNSAGSAAVTYNGKTIDLGTVNGLFKIDANAGTAVYSMENNTADTGAGTIDGNGGTLTVTKAGTFTIGLVTAATQTHEAGAKVTATLTVNRGSRNAPSAPVLNSKTTTSVSLKTVSGAEYSRDGKTWQTSVQFSGLKADTSYTFYQRYRETELYQTSSASPGITVKTEKAGDLSPAKGTVFTSGTLKYKITKKAAGKAKGTVQVVGPAKKTYQKVSVKASVKYKTFTYNVVSIAKNAFKKNNKLKTVVIGDHVKTIGNNAFRECKVLKKVTIGKKVTKIGKQAFYKSGKLRTVNIKSKKLKSGSVGKGAFQKTHKYIKIKGTSAKLTKRYRKFLNK